MEDISLQLIAEATNSNTSNNIDVTVVVPIFNKEKFLHNTLKSIVSQSLKNIQIICVDDGSTDNSLDIIKNFSQKDCRIEIIETINEGAGAARNKGLSKSKGEYIIFLDADDVYSKYLLEKLFNRAKEKKSEIVFCLYNQFYVNGSVVKNKGLNIKIERSDVNLAKTKNILSITNPPPWNKIYKRSFLIDNRLFFQNTRIANDLSFYKKTFLSANSIYFINESLVEYRMNSDNMSSTRYKYSDDVIKANLNVLDFMKSKKYAEYGNFYKSFLADVKYAFNQFPLEVDSFSFKEKIYNVFPKQYNDILKTTIGQCDIKRKIVITMTSYPARISKVHLAIRSLVAQTLSCDKIILWLAEDEFPNKIVDLPDELLALRANGLEIRWVENIRSYKKIIPALMLDGEYIFITADDDLYYPNDYVERLFNAYLKKQNVLNCLRAHKIKIKKGKIQPYKEWEKEICTNEITYLNFPTSGGGVIFDKSLLHKEVINKKIALKLSRDADDIWLWAMSVINNTKISVINPPFGKLQYIEGTQDNCDKLSFENLEQCGNDEKISNILSFFEKITTNINQDIYLSKQKEKKIKQFKETGVFDEIYNKLDLQKINISEIFQKYENITKEIRSLKKDISYYNSVFKPKSIDNKDVSLNNCIEKKSGRILTYYCQTDDSCKNIKDIPEKHPFTLKSVCVKYINDSDCEIIQELYQHGCKYIRKCVNSEWSEWNRIFPAVHHAPHNVGYSHDRDACGDIVCVGTQRNRF